MWDHDYVTRIRKSQRAPVKAIDEPDTLAPKSHCQTVTPSPFGKECRLHVHGWTVRESIPQGMDLRSRGRLTWRRCMLKKSMTDFFSFSAVSNLEDLALN